MFHVLHIPNITRFFYEVLELAIVQAADHILTNFDECLIPTAYLSMRLLFNDCLPRYSFRIQCRLAAAPIRAALEALGRFRKSMEPPLQPDALARARCSEIWIASAAVRIGKKHNKGATLCNLSLYELKLGQSN